MKGEFNSPFMELEVPNMSKREFYLFGAGWLGVWIFVSLVLLYLYAVVFASVVGFETALLVGVGLLILMSM
jgi:hypothetical protein